MGPTGKLVAWGAVLAPVLHTLTDVLEWAQGGFSPAQLWLNYIAFLPLPAVLIGLYAVQRPRISLWGLLGALLYGFAFIYFAHTTLAALDTRLTNYEQLWDRLGGLYTAHGALMVVGGFAFGVATARARVFPAWTASLFLGGVAVNLALALLPLPELLQTLGTTLRNAGLVGMGGAMLGIPHDRSRGDGASPGKV
jgi:hypothetical protein